MSQLPEVVQPIWAPAKRVGALNGVGVSYAWELISDPDFPADAVIRPSPRKTLINVAAFSDFLRLRSAKRAEEVARVNGNRKAAQSAGRRRRAELMAA